MQMAMTVQMVIVTKIMLILIVVQVGLVFPLPQEIMRRELVKFIVTILESIKVSDVVKIQIHHMLIEKWLMKNFII